jgi:hypothetical protein
MSLLLTTIPVINILFNFTNACGAALFAADLERNFEKVEGKRTGEVTVGDLKEE